MEKGRSMSLKAKKSQSAAEALTFNVAGLLGEPIGSIRDLEVSSPPLDLGSDLHQNRGVAGRLRLTRTNRGLLVKGRLSTSIAQVCSRCLRDIDYQVELVAAGYVERQPDATDRRIIRVTLAPDAVRAVEQVGVERGESPGRPVPVEAAGVDVASVQTLQRAGL